MSGTLKLEVIKNPSASADNLTLNVDGTTSTPTGAITTATNTQTLTNKTLAAATNTVEATSGPNASAFGFRNRIINGDMRIDQRNAGASLALTGDVYSLDRWKSFASVIGKLSVQRSTVTPAGFSHSMLYTSASNYAIVASDVFGTEQPIEGVNTVDLEWGTATAKPITISFHVRSSLTGTFGGVVRTAGVGYAYGFTYTINVANTWETKTVTIAGPTVGTWPTDNTMGLRLVFDLGTGSTYATTPDSWNAGNFYGLSGATSLVGTNGATFYITGVQLEKGTVATPFEYLDYSEQLRRCQRYFLPLTGGFTGYANGTTVVDVPILFPVQMRTNPAATTGSSAGSAYGAGSSYPQSSPSFSDPAVGSSQFGGVFRFSNFTALTANNVYVIVKAGIAVTTSYIGTLSAEL